MATLSAWTNVFKNGLLRMHDSDTHLSNTGDECVSVFKFSQPYSAPAAAAAI